MIKGISKQVIVVHSPDRKLFEQAIFILNNDAVEQGITDEMLLKEAKRAIHGHSAHSQRSWNLRGPLWACGGAAATGLVWLLTTLL